MDMFARSKLKWRSHGHRRVDTNVTNKASKVFIKVTQERLWLLLPKGPVLETSVSAT